LALEHKKIAKIFGSFGKTSYLCNRKPLVCKLLGSVVKEQLRKINPPLYDKYLGQASARRLYLNLII
jgi:hypothetical protein